jgi:hypothetical protein
MVKVREDKTGRVIGNFLVLGQAEDYVSPNGQKRARWNCQCLLCGNNEVTIMDTVLQKQTKQSCGCLDDLTNKRFGRLTVLYADGKDDNGCTTWRCLCDCGEQISVIHSRLAGGNVKSCGCLRQDMARERFSKENIYDMSGQYGIGYTTNTNNPFYFDLDDFNLIRQYTWFEDISTSGYRSLKAKDTNTKKKIKMSYILGCKQYDHINRNPLDNRRANLRPATDSQNAQNRSLPSNNTSGFMGVCWDKESCKWLAYIKQNQKQIKLGRYIKKEDAVRARLKAEKEYFGEFAPQRHLFEEYGIS